MRYFIAGVVAFIAAALFAVAPAQAVVLCNNAFQEIDSTGTGSPINLGAAVSGGQTIAACGITNGQVTRYRIYDGAAWEVGTGTFTDATPDTLSRTVIESSNSDTAIDLTADALVIITPLTGDLPSESTPVEGSPAAADYVFGFQSATLERFQISALESVFEGFLDIGELQGSLTLAGDVDGAHGSNDLDEANVETELEGVLDKNDLQGDLTLAGDVDGAHGANDLDEANVEAEIEPTIDTLANLTSIQSLTVTLADAGVNAFLGWDDAAGAYENLTTGEFEALIEAAVELADLQGSLTLAGDVDGAHGSNDIDEASVETELESVLDKADLQGDLTLAGDVDGAHGSNDIDEASVEAELEGVMDLAELQGSLTTAKLPATMSSFCVKLGDTSTAITTGDAINRIHMPYAFTVSGVSASLMTASSSGTVNIAIREDTDAEGGTAAADILSTDIDIEANERRSSTATTQPVVSDSSLAADSEILFDIDTAGTGAVGPLVCIEGRPT